MALTEENWSTISIDPYENYTGEKPFLVDEGDYYRGDRPVHLGHVYKRFRGRVKPQLVDPGFLTMLLEELALAEGNFVTERPAWIGGTRSADYFLEIGQYMVLPIVRSQDRIRGGERYVATTLLVRDDVDWPEAFRRGWITIPPHPGLEPELVNECSRKEALKRAQESVDWQYPPVPKVRIWEWWPPTRDNRARVKARRQERRQYELEALPRLRDFQTTDLWLFQATRETRDQLVFYQGDLERYRAALVEARRSSTPV